MRDIAEIPRARLPNIASQVDRPVPADTTSCERSLDWGHRTDFAHLDPGSIPGHIARECFEVWAVGGCVFGHLGLPIYAEIAFTDCFDPGSKLLEFAEKLSPEAFFWENMFEKRPVDLQNARRLLDSGRRQNPVYIPAEIAHPRGWFFSAVQSRPQRAKALLVAFCGRANPRLCSHCIRSYSSTVTSAREHVLFPFHDCISTSGPGRGRSNPFLGKNWSPEQTVASRPSYINPETAPRLEKVED
ncbi:hypothetical protein V8C42DRAFT_349860 [Trichoderma barbatum]